MTEPRAKRGFMAASPTCCIADPARPALGAFGTFEPLCLRKSEAHCGRTSGYSYEHPAGPQLQRSPSSGVVPKGIVDPSAKVTTCPLNARAFGSFAGHPEIVSLVPG